MRRREETSLYQTFLEREKEKKQNFCNHNDQQIATLKFEVEENRDFGSFNAGEI